MSRKKRHHYVPVSYLKSFCDEGGKIRVYRKDDPEARIHQKPENAAFSKYYYSQPSANGTSDDSLLEDFFSGVESKWPPLVERLSRRERANDALLTLFEFVSLQRVRTPASRDIAEKLHAESAKSLLRRLDAQGDLPPKPANYPNILDLSDVVIDPQVSIHAMVPALNAMGSIIDRMGFTVIHNRTNLPFLTSDNPVVYFDPSVSETVLRPYTLSHSTEGPCELFFPMTPKLVLHGHSEMRFQFGQQGLVHDDLTDRNAVKRINRFVCRFGYHFIFARQQGQEALIRKHAGLSPILLSEAISGDGGEFVLHQLVFGKRERKPKW